MTVAASTVHAPAGFDTPATLRLPLDLRLTPEQFALVCAENPDAVLELTAAAERTGRRGLARQRSTPAD
jgi:hypothetical protein